MPRKRVCCVGNCQSTRQDAILFKIPVREKRLHKWLQCLSAVCDVENLTPGKSVVCSKHFEPRFIQRSRIKPRLLVGAYPSLFSAEELTSGKSSLINFDVMPALNEHTYALKRHDDHTYSKLKTDKDDRVLRPHNVLPSASMELSLPGCSGSSNALQANVSLDDRALKPRNVLPSASVELSLPGCSGSSNALQANVSLDDRALKPPNVLPSASVEISLPGCSGGSNALQANVSLEPIHPVRKSTRKRLIPKKSLLTPLSKTIYDEYKKATHQLDYYKRVKSAVKFCKNLNLRNTSNA